MATETYFVCPRCQAGHCHLETGTYVKMTSKRPVLVPNAQVYVCDICNFHEYKPDTISQVDQLLKNVNPTTEDGLKPKPSVQPEIKSQRSRR